jgi:hypothetical protein
MLQHMDENHLLIRIPGLPKGDAPIAKMITAAVADHLELHQLHIPAPSGPSTSPLFNIQ